MKYLSLTCFCIFVLSCGQSKNSPDNRDGVYQDSVHSLQTPPDSPVKTVRGNQQAEDDFLIVPGERLGKTALNITTDSLEKLLGKPDMADAAMGKAWLTWQGKPDEHNNRTRLDIYTTYKDSTMMEKAVQQIRTTSSHFHTAGNLHVYSSMRDIRNSFPDLKKAAQYKSEGRDIIIYDDPSQGIAFEQVTANGQNICAGIMVHKRNVPVTNTYIYLEPDVQGMK